MNLRGARLHGKRPIAGLHVSGSDLDR